MDKDWGKKVVGIEHDRLLLGEMHMFLAKEKKNFLGQKNLIDLSEVEKIRNLGFINGQKPLLKYSARNALDIFGRC